MKLLLGTTNPAKVADYRKYLQHANLEVVALKDLGITDEPLEIGNTYFENAMQKARFYAERTENPTFAEDGGFEIDALGGRPGIDSKRWVGPLGSDEDRIEKVFEVLKEVPEGQRMARFRISAVVYFPDIRDYISVEKTIEGLVPQKPSSAITPGFPYDSVLFFPEGNQYWIEDHERYDPRKKLAKELLIKMEPFLNFQS